MLKLTDKGFKYVPANSTDLNKTFKREYARLKAIAKAEEAARLKARQKEVDRVVTPLARK